MGRLESGTYVQVIDTGRIGEVLSRERTNVVVEFFVRELRELIIMEIL